MALENWSYNSVVDDIKQLKALADELGEIRAAIPKESSKFDSRVYNNLSSNYDFSTIQLNLDKAKSHYNTYIQYVNNLNEEANRTEAGNYAGAGSGGYEEYNTGPNPTTPAQPSSSGQRTENPTQEPETGSSGGTTVIPPVVVPPVTDSEPEEEKDTEPNTRSEEEDTEPDTRSEEEDTEPDTRSEEEKDGKEDGKVNGSTGFCSQNMKAEPKQYSTTLGKIEWGEPFKIIKATADDSWWEIEYNGQKGYVEAKKCLINLPDYIPSIEYNITNASSSIFVSSGQPLSVYGQQLYTSGKVFNQRLDREEYIVPLSYGFAKKIKVAEAAALAAGYKLKIYDAYRPVSVAGTVKNALAQLYRENSEVAKNIDRHPTNGSTWGKAWFIADGISYHSVGCAIDVTLANKSTGAEIETPSAMHELSTKAVKYKYGVKGQTVIQPNLYVDDLSEDAKLLDKIMLGAGLTNLASEWWHFQDNASAAYMPALDFQPTKIVSEKSSIKENQE